MLEIADRPRGTRPPTKAVKPPLPPAESRGPSAQAYAPGYHPSSARAAQWLKCAYDTRRVRANSTNAATTTTHSTPPHAHRTAHTTSVFQSVLQLFLGALAVHSGAQLLVIHVPRVPANDGRTPLSPARPCGQRCAWAAKAFLSGSGGQPWSKRSGL